MNLGYVVNVIEDPIERAECLRKAWSFARKALIVSARLASQSTGLVPTGHHADGCVTSIGTFQKFYEQRELADWVEAVLGKRAVAAAPGVFYVFRDSTDRAAFLARRFEGTTVRSRTTAVSIVLEHRELLEPLIAFFHRHARAPREDELSDPQRIAERFGSVRRAFRLIERTHDRRQWRLIIAARTQELLLFLALSRFDGRVPMGRLPTVLQRDLRSLFSTYRRACEEADRALLAIGDPTRIARAARQSSVGKRMPTAIYVHKSALEGLPLALRLYEGCARRYIGHVAGANVVKLHVDEPLVSYLSYPDFESDPHPALRDSLTVHLQSFNVRERSYAASRNPPILHRKEAFVLPEHPLRPKFARLTRIEESKGLYSDTPRIGTRDGWIRRLQEKGLSLRGHRLIRSAATHPPGDEPNVAA